MKMSRQMIKWKYVFIMLFLLFILNTSIASAQLNLPPGLEAIKEYNQEYAMRFLQTISIPLVFLAGVLSIISPCILPLIPAFFSYTFKEKRSITKMTLIFFLGFSSIFVILGVSAAYLGKSISLLQLNISNLVIIAGLGLIFFGIMIFLGRGFSSFLKTTGKPKSGNRGVFLMGIFFATGWSACLGPIIAGILLVVATFGNIMYGAILLFVYSLGIMTPLLILSIFYDRFNLGNSKWIQGREITFNVSGKRIVTHTTEMISGILLIGMGLIFILFGGTNIINSLSPIGSSFLFNELQRFLIESPTMSGIIGFVVLVLLLVGIILVFRRRKDAT